MGLYRRGNIFWFTLKYQGKRIQESLNTDDERFAERLYDKALTEIAEGRYFESVKAKQTTFAEMTKKYMERHQKSRDKQTIKQLLPVFGNLALADITTEKVSDYMNRRLKKVKPATVYQELALMRRMFNVARRQWKWTTENPVADLSFSVGNKNSRDRWLTLEEEEKLLRSASPEWLQQIIVFAIHTGMRRGEILGLTWKSVDHTRKLLTVERSKNGEKRSIPMSDTLFQMMGKPKVIDISNRVFPISVHMLKYHFQKTRKRAGISNFRFHDLRHTFATRLVQYGVDLYKVKVLLGHKTIAMTMRYAHHYPESLRSSVAVLDSCYSFATIASTGSCPEGEKSFKINDGSA